MRPRACHRTPVTSLRRWGAVRAWGPCWAVPGITRHGLALLEAGAAPPGHVPQGAEEGPRRPADDALDQAGGLLLPGDQVHRDRQEQRLARHRLHHEVGGWVGAGTGRGGRARRAGLGAPPSVQPLPPEGISFSSRARSRSTPGTRWHETPPVSRRARDITRLAGSPEPHRPDSGDRSQPMELTVYRGFASSSGSLPCSFWWHRGAGAAGFPQAGSLRGQQPHAKREPGSGGR